VTDSDFCFFHEPRCEAQRKAASSAGGKAGKPAIHSDLPFFSLRTSSDICNLYEVLAGRLYKGRTDHRTANSVAQLCNILRRALELAVEEAGIEDLEAIGRGDTPLHEPSERPTGSRGGPVPDGNEQTSSDKNHEPASVRVPLRTTAEIIDLLENAINLVIKSEMDHRTANSIGFIASSRVQFIAMELEERMARLEAAEE
jgi:hypothetical protein